jgi:hypothetical protein
MRRDRALPRLLVVTAAFALGFGTAAAAQPAPGNTPSDPAENTVDSLTVTAPPQPKAEQLPSIVSKFVDSHGSPSPGSRAHQLSRWKIAVCAKTGGLSQPFNDFVSARVAQTAVSVGAAYDKDPACSPNLLIIFTTRPQALLDNIRKDHPQMLGFHYAAQVKRLATIKRPIQAWYLTATKDFQGGIHRDFEFQRPMSGQAGSRLTANISSEFVGALVVVDTTKIAGQRIGAIADHVAMLSLARPGTLKTCTELPSILDALDADCPSSLGVDAMTPYDLAYLKGLYAVNPEENLQLQQRKITTRIVREVGSR